MNIPVNYSYQLPIEKVLDKLDMVKPKKATEGGLNQWQAICPSHADKSPSLTITECTDNTVLLKCWAGCNASEIVQAIGLELKDLFKHEPNKQGNSNRPIKKLPNKQAIEHEQLIVDIAKAQLTKGLTLSQADNKRYQLALQRLMRLQHVK